MLFVVVMLQLRVLAVLIFLPAPAHLRCGIAVQFRIHDRVLQSHTLSRRVQEQYAKTSPYATHCDAL